MDPPSDPSDASGSGSEETTSRQRAETEVWAIVRVACRGLAVGAGLHAGIKLLAGINSRKLQNNPLAYLSKLVTADTVRFASFVALSGSAYKIVLALLKSHQHGVRVWHSVLAGMAAGLASFIDDPSRRRTLSLFITARALGTLISTLYSHGFLPTIPHFLNMTYAAVQSLMLLCICRFPQLLPHSYYRTVLSWTIYYTEENTQLLFRGPSKHFIPCNPTLHQGSCHALAARDVVSSLLLFFKIYLTVYSMPLLLFRSKQLMEFPWRSLRNLLKKTSISTLFFGLNASILKYMLCLLRNAWGLPPPIPLSVPLLAGLISSVTVVIERDSRKLEMIYYGLPQLFYAVWRLLCIKKPLGLHRIPFGSVILFSFSLMVLMFAYEHEKAALPPIIKGSLKFLLQT